MVVNDSRISFSGTNGQQLNFATLALLDDEYYSCGYLSNNKFQINSNYYLFIRGKIGFNLYNLTKILNLSLFFF